MSNTTYLSDQPVWQRRLAKTLLLIIIISIIILYFIPVAETEIKDLEICVGVVWPFAYNIIRSES